MNIREKREKLERMAYDKVIEMKMEGKSSRDIADETGYSKSKVINICKNHLFQQVGMLNEKM